MTGSHPAPRVVWSMDFELRWGLHDRLGMDFGAYRANLEGARQAVPELLDLFVQRGVRATWATVGAVACRDWDEYWRRAPPPPRYADTRLAVSRRYADLDPEGVLHFAPDLVRLIAQTQGQELGTHTFSHIFLGEPGVIREDAEADHAAVVAMFREGFATAPTSLVFPRNQVAFLDSYRASGISAWRDNEVSWYYRHTKLSDNPFVRARRLADALTPWHTRAGLFADGRTPSTLFVRVNLPEMAWKAHIAKITAEARRATSGDVLHFWLHPHNVGGNMRLGMARLVHVLDTLERCSPKGTAYASMRDLATTAAENASAAQPAAGRRFGT